MKEQVVPSGAVSVRLLGGLGNQLFQYAAGRALSLKHGCPLLLDVELLKTQKPHRPYALDAFNINAAISEIDDGWLEYEQTAFHYDPAFEALPVGTRLSGHFQSELYFAEFCDEIRRELALIRPTSDQFREYERAIDNASYSVSIHVRRGDFVNDQWTFDYFGICETPYYEKAKRIIEGLSTANPTYFVFSDDPEAAEALLHGTKNLVFVRTPLDAPSEDLSLIARCHSHILANSSFSWWSSYLNSKSEKIIIAPRSWVSRAALRTLNTVDLYIDGTIII